jgi:subtilisin family serine protease
MEIMKKIFLYLLISLSLLLPGKDGMAGYVPGEVLVKFKDTSDASSIKKLHAPIGASGKREFKRIKVHHVKLPEEVSVEQAIQYYRQDPNVEYAEPNYIVHATATPDDTSFSSLWGLNNTGQTGGAIDADIDAPEAWEHTTGSDDVIIAVIDTGVAYDHPDFADNIWTNAGEIPGNGLDDDGNGYIDDVYGWDLIDNDGYPEDFNSHGTHVAGTIAAQGNNGLGVTGVMWNARIMVIRFLGLTGSGSVSDAIEAIEYAGANGAQIINNSWGGTGYSQALKDAIDAFPGIVVCAAGNGGIDGVGDNNDTTPFYPASYSSSNIIAVAATDDDDHLASFSNFGVTKVDLAAPGVSIYSSIPQFAYGAAVTEYSENFDSSFGDLPLLGWSRGGTNSTWAVTGGTGVGGSNSLEDSPGGNYLADTNSWAGYMTPLTSVKNNRYTLTFDWKGELENGFDYLYINYSPNGSAWDWIDHRTGPTGGGFVQYSADFTPVADSLDQFYFGFGLYSDDSVNYTGAYIDNVTLTREPISISGYSYASHSGTSMAAPHVSGVAGLIKALIPGLSTAEIKDAILKSIDAKSQLKGKTLTGGRLNALKALEYALSPYTPTGLSATKVSSSQVDLSWTDHSDKEEGFIIERNSGDGAPFSQIASVGPNVTSYSDTGLSPAVYIYRVRVYGTDLGDYAYSNEAFANIQVASIDRGGGGGGGGGGCFIATAAYGSMMHPYVKALREFRDNHLLTNAPGRAFVDFYYTYSPPLADVIRDHEYLRSMTRLMLAPAVMFVVFPFASSAVFVSLIITFVLVLKRSKR